MIHKICAPLKKTEIKIIKNNKKINIIQTGPIIDINDISNNSYIDGNSRSIINNNNEVNNKSKVNFQLGENKEKKMNIKFILTYNIYELNNLSYNDALRFDKRNYITYYFSLLKTNHPLINSFYPINDYNSRIIKIFLSFFCL